MHKPSLKRKRCFFSGLATHSSPWCSAISPRDSTLDSKNGSMLLIANTWSL
ncbi:Uncharacterised protein [Shigella sonnei]|nr:Uncharacterised protein [Shigella sonnei]